VRDIDYKGYMSGDNSMAIRRIAAKYALLLAFITIVVLIAAYGNSENAEKKKKLYISSIKAEGLSKTIAKRVREGLSLAIFGNYGRQYHVLDDDAIRVMYSQAEKMLASGCTDYSCMTQIADGINADEIIYGEVRREGPNIRLVLSNLQRNRKTLSIGTKSKVSISFPESQLDHFAKEAALKLMDSRYRISREVKGSIDEGISLSSIKVEKVKGLDIAVMRFTSSDDIISQMLGYLKELVGKGDESFKSRNYSGARSEYGVVLERISSKLVPEQQRKMQDFISGVKKRIATAYIMEIKGDIEKIDRDLESGKKGDESVLEDFIKQYTAVSGRIDGIPGEYRGEMESLKNAVTERVDSIYIAMISLSEKKGDGAYREYRFGDAIVDYERSLQRAGSIANRKNKIEHQKKIEQKLETARVTGESYLTNRVKSLLDQASFYNLKDETGNARDTMERARSLIEKSTVETWDARKQYNRYAAVIKVEKLPLTRTKEIGGIAFIYIHGGSFLMGSKDGGSDEKPAHGITVDGFWIGKFEITQSQYEAIMGKNPSHFMGSAKSHDSLHAGGMLREGTYEIERPVENVSWNDAVEFCRKFSIKYGVRARLPYEAEWEYACRADTSTRYNWGNSINGDYCWYGDNSDKSTHTVGKKKPNAWELYDMSGNVWEWCMDWYDVKYYRKSPSNNPKGPSSGRYRVLRGGSWDSSGDRVCSHTRYYKYGHNYKASNLGFRLVLTVD
jgi:sulfatase modifying factor 1